jgi:hypothetical protein
VAVRAFKVSLLVLQAFWMLVVLPGHVRGMIALGGPGGSVADAPAAAGADDGPSCCAAGHGAFKPGDTPGSDRKDRCAVCYQAHGYAVPPVYDVDLVPTGLCELRRLIEPSKRHRLLCRPTYFANGPPASLV